MSNQKTGWELGTHIVESAASYATVALLGGAAWLVRRVFTNQKQIEALQTHLESRDEMRQRDRDDIQELKKDVKTLTSHLLNK